MSLIMYTFIIKLNFSPPISRPSLTENIHTDGNCMYNVYTQDFILQLLTGITIDNCTGETYTYASRLLLKRRRHDQTLVHARCSQACIPESPCHCTCSASILRFPRDPVAEILNVLLALSVPLLSPSTLGTDRRSLGSLIKYTDSEISCSRL